MLAPDDQGFNAPIERLPHYLMVVGECGISTASLSSHVFSVHEYLGIPMAKPPIGVRRFRRPEAVEPWPNMYNATKRSKACYNVEDLQFGSKSLIVCREI